jgi:hypothetical protein
VQDFDELVFENQFVMWLLINGNRRVLGGGYHHEREQ